MYLTLMLPKMISLYNDHTERFERITPKVQLGIQALVTDSAYAHLKSLNLGLVVGPDSVDQHKNRTLDLLLENGFAVKKVAMHIATPVGCDAPAPQQFTTLDTATKLPLLQLREPTLAAHAPRFFSDIDGVIFDVGMSGLRSDHTVSLLTDVLQEAAKLKKKVIITDRINPLGPCMEGPGEIPLRPGITIAELGRFLNTHVLSNRADLTTISLQGWHRDEPLRGLSAGPERFEGAFDRSLLELLSSLKPLEVTLGTQGEASLLFPQDEQPSTWEYNYLRELCDKLGLVTSEHSYWSKEKKRLYKGIKISSRLDAGNASIVNTLLTLTRFLSQRKSVVVSCTPAFDSVMGDDEVRRFFEHMIGFDTLKSKVEKSVSRFARKVRNCLLYKPFPEAHALQIIRV